MTLAQHSHVKTTCFDESRVAGDRSPDDSLPVDATEKMTSWKLNHCMPKRCVKKQVSPWNAWQEHILTLPLWEQELLERITCCMPTEDTMMHGVTDKMHFASDGSVEGAKGAFGWTSAASDGHGSMANSGPVRGTQPGGSF